MATQLSFLLSGALDIFFSSKVLASHLFSDSALCAFILDWAIHYVTSSPP